MFGTLFLEMEMLTPKQIQILEWIERYLGQFHTMPSRREIAEGLGLSSPATIQQHIEALEKKGFLKRGEARESRALQWTGRSKKFLAAMHSSSQSQTESDAEGVVVGLHRRHPQPPPQLANHRWNIPMLGTIAAGYPIEVFPEEKTVSLPLDLFARVKEGISEQQLAEQFYALTVRGDSMIDEGIFPNDWVVLRRGTQAKNGDTVAALLNGEATLKKFVKSKGMLELHPANPNYPIIPIEKNDRFEIQGILMGLIRRYES